MILIEEVEYRGTSVRFYNGVDFDILLNHSKDGSDGFIYCFMDSWIKEVKSYNRNNKLKSIIDSTEYSDFEWESINNDYVAIYQADGIDINLLYQAIREKVIQNNLPVSPYISIAEVNGSNIINTNIINNGGAWKIEIGKSDS
jgi:hypothetical protein